MRLDLLDGVEPLQPYVGEMAPEHGLQVVEVEEMQMERVFEVGGLVRGEDAHHAVVPDHTSELGHVRLGVGEVLDQMGRAHAVEAAGADAEFQRVHLRHAQALRPVAGQRGGDRLGRVVDTDHLAARRQEADGLESVAAPDVQNATAADTFPDDPVPGLVQRQQGVRRDALHGPLTRQPAFVAAGHVQIPS